MADRRDESSGFPEAPGEAPLEALARLRAKGLDREEGWKRELGVAAVAASGEVGYRHLSVKLILERSGASRNRFYRLFPDKAHCYTYGYRVLIEGLAQDLLAPARHATRWREGFRPGLEELARFLASDPHLAKGLLAEVYAAGEPALAKRNEVFERLSRAIDLARRENESRHSPPPITAEFILRAIEAAVISALLGGGPRAFAACVPELTYIATVFYFGQEAAPRSLEANGAG